jgi:hypothetical protein
MLEVLGKGFGETLLTRRVFPILLLGLRTGKRNPYDLRSGVVLSEGIHLRA